MAKVLKIQAENRDRVGKGASRAARRAGMVPAVIYGDNREPRSIQIKINEVVRLLNRGGFMSHTYQIETDGKVSATVLPRDLQLHPVTDMPMHIDFLRLAEGSTVVMNVPVQITDDEDAPGVKQGGTVTVNRHDIELNVPVDAIPEAIVVSLAGIELGGSVKISDVKLPKGVTPTITDRDFVIAAITAPSSLKSSEGSSEEGEEGGADDAAAEGGEE
ncbi:50S ribosomal protein L25/general stress protein Ctc [Temperatibacter marinus]|uniref:Large ribosomal subunit protein bL25 n=1 Tax=Temperatibacter marinus TaxID=1456591 RepID=A0AA52EIU8_9PROT|nr:50S ribosomal protein L25/general stress protein Ctc [Temperatibacter marinus]WND03089.1 50S ribosomal protein L25/general stress protein Ctc [Temperatibacter marinus]